MLLLNLPADEFDEDVDGDLAEKIKEFYLDDEEDRDGLFSSQENTYRAVQMFGDAFCLSGTSLLIIAGVANVQTLPNRPCTLGEVTAPVLG